MRLPPSSDSFVSTAKKAPEAYFFLGRDRGSTASGLIAERSGSGPFTPSGGISTVAVQKMPFSTRVRRSSIRQLQASPSWLRDVRDSVFARSRRQPGEPFVAAVPAALDQSSCR